MAEREFDAFDGCCAECGDEFHLDDVGGYNPPCVCGAHCRSCHRELELSDPEYLSDEDDPYFPECDDELEFGGEDGDSSSAPRTEQEPKECDLCDLLAGAK